MNIRYPLYEGVYRILTHNGGENKLSSVVERTSEPDIDPGR